MFAIYIYLFIYLYESDSLTRHDKDKTKLNKYISNPGLSPMAPGQGTLSGHISSSCNCRNLLHHPPPEAHQPKPT